MENEHIYIKHLNTEILPIIDAGLYESAISPNTLADDYYGDPDCEHTSDDEESFDFEAFKMDILDIAADIMKAEWVEAIGKQLGVNELITTSYDSPREYNFETDCIIFALDVTEDFEERVAKRLTEIYNLPCVQEYIKNLFMSRDGFCSKMPTTLAETLNFNTTQCYAAALTLISLADGYDFDWAQNKFEENVYSNVFYGNYVTFKGENEDEDDNEEQLDF